MGSCCSLTHRSAFACCPSPVVPLSYPGSFFLLANLTKTSHRTSQCQFPNEPCPVVTTGFWSTSPLGWIHSSCYSARPLVTTARALPKVSSGCLGGADNSDSCTALPRCDASALLKSVLSCGSEPSVFSVPKHAPFSPIFNPVPEETTFRIDGCPQPYRPSSPVPYLRVWDLNLKSEGFKLINNLGPT